MAPATLPAPCADIARAGREAYEARCAPILVTARQADAAILAAWQGLRAVVRALFQGEVTKLPGLLTNLKDLERWLP